MFTMLRLAIFLLLVHVAAGRLQADSGGYNDGFQLGAPPDTLQGAKSRDILQLQAEDVAVSSGVFSNVPPCQPLLDIITTAPDPSNKLGNFTKQPTEDLLRDCTTNNAAYLLHGTALAEALKEPLPLVKIVKMAPPTIVWPLRTVSPRFAPGSINLVDCQHEILDLRNWAPDDPTEDTILIWLDCVVLYPDITNTLTTLAWNINTGTVFPCDGAGELAQSAQFPRDAPRAFAGADDEVLSAQLGPISTVHVINGSLWCYTAADLEDMLPSEEDEAPAQDGGLPTWALVVIIIGGLMLVCIVSGIVWALCGAPCCGYGRREQSRPGFQVQGSAKSSKSSFRNQRGSVETSTVADRSTEELAEALSVVIKTHRLRTASQCLGTSSSAGKNGSQYEAPSLKTSTSQGTRYFDAAGVLRECPDCGQPHPDPGPTGHRGSLRAQSDTHSGSDPVSGSAGARGGDNMHCSNCAAHMGDRHRSVTDLRGDLRDQHDRLADPKHPGYMHASPVSFQRRSTSQSGGVSTGIGRKITEAWVEDSLEARAAMATAWDHASEVHSVDGQCSTASISLAPPRRGAIDGLDALAYQPPTEHAARRPPPQGSHPPRRNSGGFPDSPERSMSLGAPPQRAHAAAEQQRHARGCHGVIGGSDHEGYLSPSPSPLPSPSRPRIMEPLRGLHDANGGTRIPWLPPQEGLVPSPKGSPRKAHAMAPSEHHSAACR